MKVSRRRIQSIKKRIQSMKSMKRRIQSMKNMKSMKSKKGTRRAKSMGYKSRTSIKSRKSRKSRKSIKSSVSDNSIETSINAIISDINKKNLSINDKIEMISNELSKLPTIKFYGSLYIPNLSSLDNEGDAIELHNGGMPPRKTEPEQTGRMTDEDRKVKNEQKQIDINKKITRLENQIETLSKKNPIPIRDIKKKTEAESELKQLKMDLEQLIMESNQLDAMIKASKRLQEETARTEETEKEEQKLKIEAAALRKICDENIITPLTTIIDEAARLDKNLRATINIGANDTNVETVLEKIINTANKKISNHRESIEKASKVEEADKETKREEELKELKRKGKKLDSYHEKMYIRGYEKAKKVTSVNEYVRTFELVNDARSNLTKKLNEGLNGIQVVSRVLMTNEDVNDTGCCWFFFDKMVEERHVQNPSRTYMSMFHLTVHLGTRIGMSEDPHMGKTHIVHHDHDITKLEESVNMYPFNFTRTKTRPETDNNIGPDTCMQVIPIFPPDAVNKEIKIKIATILNTFLYNLQIKKHSDTLWNKTKRTSQIDIRFQDYQQSLETKSNRIKRTLRIKELTNLIAKAINIIERMSNLFLMLLHNDYKHCIEHIKGILQRCKNFLTNLTGLLEKHITKINNMSDADGNNTHITTFEETMGMNSGINSTKLTELTEDTTIAPDIEEISEKITNALGALSNLGEAEGEAEGEAQKLYTSFKAQLNNAIENIDIENDARKAITDNAETIFAEKIDEFFNDNSKFPNMSTGIQMGIEAIDEAKQNYYSTLPQTQPTPSAPASSSAAGPSSAAPAEEKKPKGKAIVRYYAGGKGKNKITKKRLNKITRKRLNKTKKRKYK